MNKLIFLCLASFLISLLCVNLIRTYFRQQLLDLPNERSSHTHPTPRGGGLGFVIAFAITSAISSLISYPTGFNLNLWFSLVPLIIIGIIDDYQGVSALKRYFVQFFAASIAVFCFGAFFFPMLDNFAIFGQIIAIGITAVGMTAIINFYNFMDGLDGLAAGCTTVQLAFLAVYLNQPIWWLLVAALLGFLRWNWSPAKIFMGDTGSTFLGAIVAIALLDSTKHPLQTWSALFIMTPLIGDAIYTICRRLKNKENIFQAHRSHLYQRLHKSGWSHQQVAISYIASSILVAVLIGLWGAIGAGISLFIVILAIIRAEFYLYSNKAVQANS